MLLSVGMLLLTVSMQACDEFEYSPYEVRLDEDEKDLNKRNIAAIEALDIAPTDTVRFVLTADPQGFYQENEQLVRHINQLEDIDFVLLGGDLTDFGLVKEFKLVHEDFKTLKVPYVAVVGNHDAINNGKEVFSAMYGDYDVSFAVGNTKFILLNTNYLEFDKQVPDLDWLEAELKASATYENVIVVSHIPPTNTEFGEEKSVRYGQLLNQYKVDFSLHGHNHNYKYHFPFGEELPVLETAATEKLEYVVFTVAGNEVSFERVKI
ncbi:calcineurin-like phosphoesterase family protein [Pontibacter ummariensis]|uniref:Calcineurin-like phosphoesterase n=1 Tax=Pontibacter ummariensis TaxID=1610492 RepID=A0A239JRX0_9BACT|nr:calcineurin-like phosphoesterase family protein [Pontibacter ummariensis]SNT08575.1 Calcineurin-like phosphoesterase [Pontibacter ummariensis]